jgi:hypothetical protein
MVKRRVRRTRRARPRRGGRSRRGAVRRIELRPVRKQAERLVTKLRQVEDPDRKVRLALQALTQVIRQIRRVCGPVMSIIIPIKPR